MLFVAFHFITHAYKIKEDFIWKYIHAIYLGSCNSILNGEKSSIIRSLAIEVSRRSST